MKIFVIALALVGANAMACSDAKDAMAPKTDKSVVATAVKAKPAVTQRAAGKATPVKVAAQPSTDLRKSASL